MIKRFLKSSIRMLIFTYLYIDGAFLPAATRAAGRLTQRGQRKFTPPQTFKAPPSGQPSSVPINPSSTQSSHLPGTTTTKAEQTLKQPIPRFSIRGSELRSAWGTKAASIPIASSYQSLLNVLMTDIQTWNTQMLEITQQVQMELRKLSSDNYKVLFIAPDILSNLSNPEILFDLEPSRDWKEVKDIHNNPILTFNTEKGLILLYRTSEKNPLEITTVPSEYNNLDIIKTRLGQVLSIKTDSINTIQDLINQQVKKEPEAMMVIPDAPAPPAEVPAEIPPAPTEAERTAKLQEAEERKELLKKEYLAKRAIFEQIKAKKESLEKQATESAHKLDTIQKDINLNTEQLKELKDQREKIEDQKSGLEKKGIYTDETLLSLAIKEKKTAQGLESLSAQKDALTNQIDQQFLKQEEEIKALREQALTEATAASKTRESLSEQEALKKETEIDALREEALKQARQTSIKREADEEAATQRDAEIIAQRNAARKARIEAELQKEVDEDYARLQDIIEREKEIEGLEKDLKQANKEIQEIEEDKKTARGLVNIAIQNIRKKAAQDIAHLERETKLKIEKIRNKKEQLSKQRTIETEQALEKLNNEEAELKIAAAQEFSSAQQESQSQLEKIENKRKLLEQQQASTQLEREQLDRKLEILKTEKQEIQRFFEQERLTIQQKRDAELKNIEEEFEQEREKLTRKFSEAALKEIEGKRQQAQAAREAGEQSELEKFTKQEEAGERERKTALEKQREESKALRLEGQKKAEEIIKAEETELQRLERNIESIASQKKAAQIALENAQRSAKTAEIEELRAREKLAQLNAKSELKIKNARPEQQIALKKEFGEAIHSLQEEVALKGTNKQSVQKTAQAQQEILADIIKDEQIAREKLKEKIAKKEKAELFKDGPGEKEKIELSHKEPIIIPTPEAIIPPLEKPILPPIEIPGSPIIPPATEAAIIPSADPELVEPQAEPVPEIKPEIKPAEKPIRPSQRPRQTISSEKPLAKPAKPRKEKEDIEWKPITRAEAASPLGMPHQSQFKLTPRRFYSFPGYAYTPQPRSEPNRPSIEGGAQYRPSEAVSQPIEENIPVYTFETPTLQPFQRPVREKKPDIEIIEDYTPAQYSFVTPESKLPRKLATPSQERPSQEIIEEKITKKEPHGLWNRIKQTFNNIVNYIYSLFNF